MAFQEITKIRYIKTTEAKPGDELVTGWYRGMTIDPKFNGQQHHFVTETGEAVVVNGKGQLNHILSKRVNLDDFVKVIFEGKEKLATGPKAGTEINTFKVLIDPSRSGKGQNPQPTEFGGDADDSDEEEPML